MNETKRKVGDSFKSKVRFCHSTVKYSGHVKFNSTKFASVGDINSGYTVPISLLLR